jgi:hypothetical protein
LTSGAFTFLLLDDSGYIGSDFVTSLFINIKEAWFAHMLLPRFPRFCRFASFSVRRRLTVRILADELIPSNALADHLRRSQFEAVKIIHAFALIVAERLFVEITKQVKWFN